MYALIFYSDTIKQMDLNIEVDADEVIRLYIYMKIRERVVQWEENLRFLLYVQSIQKWRNGTVGVFKKYCHRYFKHGRRICILL